jgi:hypothetical protein
MPRRSARSVHHAGVQSVTHRLVGACATRIRPAYRSGLMP